MEKRKKVIIDCDPGIDDSLALLLALKSEELEVIGITIVCGNVPIKEGGENALKTLEILKALHIPVYLGKEKPLKRQLVTAQDTHGDDGLGQCFFEKVEGGKVQEGVAIGQTIVDKENFWGKSHNALLMDKVDSKKFMYKFLETIFKENDAITRILKEVI